MTIRLLLADDQALPRGTFRLLIDAQPDMEVVAEASNGREAVELARSEPADVVVMDIRLPEVDGIEATRLIGRDEDLVGTTFEVSARASNGPNSSTPSASSPREKPCSPRWRPKDSSPASSPSLHPATSRIQHVSPRSRHGSAK